ncbi:peptidylprolyl isomerase [Hyunsoonleella rubra]|uniref:peptidylprolyl isomerase n=1 Tax=Hyunsoonleella rubra TaxID=1737062 RepID=A0ABW5TF23_9FLAO
MSSFNILTKELALFLLATVCSCNSEYPDLEDGLYAEFNTNKGIIVAKLHYDKVPITTANFVALAEGTNPLASKLYKEKPFYDGTIFHRVVENFMIQGGDPLGNGEGDPGYRFMDEFHPDLKHNKKGVLAMANSGYGTNGSQFYITHKETPWLDAYGEHGNLRDCEHPKNHCHSIFGEVVLGENIIDSIMANDTLRKLRIIRKGRSAKNFEAPEVFIENFSKADLKEQKRKAKIAKLKKAVKQKHTQQETEAIALASGLKYFISEKGSGPEIKEFDKAMVHYALFFEDGTLLNTSNLNLAEAMEAVNPKKKATKRYQPIKADLSPDAPMIAGFKEGLKELQVGDKATLFIPYHLGYGEAGGQGIPPKSNLVFEVEVLSLAK